MRRSKVGPKQPVEASSCWCHDLYLSFLEFMSKFGSKSENRNEKLNRINNKKSDVKMSNFSNIKPAALER